MPSIIYTVFKSLGFDKFTICINNRKILNGLFESLNQKENAVEILRIIDKIDKIGKEAVKEELSQLNISLLSVDKIIDFMMIQGTSDEKIAKLETLGIDNENYKKGVEELKEVVKNIRLFGILDTNFKVDLTIARGLDYYTGTVYETFLDDHREIGSICSGGRYENLAQNYTTKKLPGVGISIGLTRLFYQLKELELIREEQKSIAQVLIIPMLHDLEEPIKLATELRNFNIKTEIYLSDKKVKTKFKYADKLNIPYVIVIGEDEIAAKTVKIKNMQTGEEKVVELEAKKIVNTLK